MKQPQLAYLHRIQQETPFLTLNILADLHIALPRRNKNLDAAFEDIWLRNEKHLVLLGDLTNNGYAFQWKQCLSQVQEYPFETIAALGNHDLYNVSHRHTMHIHPLYRSMILQDSHHIYYDRVWNGIHMYVLNPQHPDKSCTVLKQDQLHWLKKGLEKDDPNTPVLVFCHHPIARTHPDTDDIKMSIGYQSDALKEIVSKHANVLYFSAHIHHDASVCSVYVQDCFLIDVPSFHQVKNGEKRSGLGYQIQFYHGFAYLRIRDYLRHCWIASHERILAFNDPHVYALDAACQKLSSAQ